jgi:hypothetical protein
MAILVGIDETSGSQDTSGGGATSNDVGGSLPVLFSTALSFETLAGSVNPVSATALSGATTSSSTGTNVMTFSGTEQDVAFTTSGGAPVSGVDSGITTISGLKIYMYTSSHDNNVLLGREATAGGLADPSGTVAFALYMDTGTGTSSDAGATGAKLWLAQFEALHQDSATNTPNDFVSLAQDLYVTESTQVNFSLSGAPSGNNLFLMFGDGTPSTSDVTIVVSGKNPADQSSGANISTGDTVVTSQGGVGDTTIGTNNQMIDPGEGMYFTFVKGANPDFTIPNLTATEANVEANIDFTQAVPVTSASFLVSQLQPPKGVTLKLTAVSDPTLGSGTTYVDNLHNGDDSQVNIGTVTITRTVTVHKVPTTQTYTFTEANNTAQAGISVDFGGSTAKITGLVAGDRVTYVADGSHDRLLVENAGNSNANLNSSFDIGGFRLETSSVATQDVGNVAFIDDAPTLAFGNVIGTGTVNAQYGTWSMAPGVDGLGTNGVDMAMTAFQLVKPDNTVVSGTSFAFSETAPSPDGSGNYHFTGSVTGDLDNNAGTPDITEHFTMTVFTNGTYNIDLQEGFMSTTTESTANGSLGAGGPDAVQTLTVGSDHIVFFSAVPTASASDLIALGTESGAADFTEAQLESAHPAVIDFTKAMNVSTSGIGDANNNLQGDATASIGAGDEAFVANPGTQFTSAKVFIDNSVQGYSYTGGERMYYRILYIDGTDSGQVLITQNLGLANKGQPTFLTIDGGGKAIDAIELTMATGVVKIPEIQFITQTNNLADGLKLSFTATVADGDGDTASSAFQANLSANALSGAFDFVLNGAASALDWFNVDLTQSATKYQVNGFDTGTTRDKLVLLGNAGATFSIDNTGADAIVTVNETGGQTDTITVVGVDLLNTDVTLI